MQRSKIFSTTNANIIMVAMITISSLLSNLFSFGQYAILFEIIFIFYCTLVAPKALPFWLLVAYGLFKDFLCFKAFGYHAILFTSFRFILESQEIELEHASFKTLWMRFIFSLFAAFILQGFIMSIVMKYNFYRLLKNFLPPCIATAICWPIFYYIFRKDIKLAGSHHDLP